MTVAIIFGLVGAVWVGCCIAVFRFIWVSAQIDKDESK